MKWALLLLAGILFLSCSTQEDTPNFVGAVTLSSGSVDSIYVGLYNYYSYDRDHDFRRPSNPKYLYAFTGNDFSLKAEPGRYTLIAYAYGYEVVKKRIFIPNKETVLTADISLTPLGVHSDIKEVKLIGSFCKWKVDSAVAMVCEGEKWIPAPELPVKVGTKYQFIVDGLARNDLSYKNIEHRSSHADFLNFYEGDSIVFNPQLYVQPRQKSLAVIEGYALLEQYDHICDEMKEKTDGLMPMMISIRESKPKEWQEKYTKIIEELDAIEKKYDPVFNQFIIEMRLSRLNYIHPVMNDLRQARGDSLKLKEVWRGHKGDDFFATQLSLINALDPKSLLLKGDFATIFVFLDGIIKDVPELKIKYNLKDDHFYNFLIEFVKKSTNKKLCSQVLFSVASVCARKNEAEKATFLINWLKKDYADEFYVGKGHADKVLTILKVAKGKPAPDFEVTTLKGKVIKLSDLRGKYVFIDFWGSWCSPCIGELPNIKKLANAAPKDKLYIIGLVTDDEKAMRKFLKKEPLPYENAMVPEEVISAYGIFSYPTTLLIDPDGVICAKNLRGENLTELVLKKMGPPVSE